MASGPLGHGSAHRILKFDCTNDRPRGLTPTRCPTPVDTYSEDDQPPRSPSIALFTESPRFPDHQRQPPPTIFSPPRTSPEAMKMLSDLQLQRQKVVAELISAKADATAALAEATMAQAELDAELQQSRALLDVVAKISGKETVNRALRKGRRGGKDKNQQDDDNRKSSGNNGDDEDCNPNDGNQNDDDDKENQNGGDSQRNAPRGPDPSEGNNPHLNGKSQSYDSQRPSDRHPTPEAFTQTRAVHIPQASAPFPIQPSSPRQLIRQTIDSVSSDGGSKIGDGDGDIRQRKEHLRRGFDASVSSPCASLPTKDGSCATSRPTNDLCQNLDDLDLSLRGSISNPRKHPREYDSDAGGNIEDDKHPGGSSKQRGNGRMLGAEDRENSKRFPVVWNMDPSEGRVLPTNDDDRTC